MSDALDTLHRIVNTRLFDVGDTSVTLSTLLVALTIVLVTLLASRALQKATDRALRLRGAKDAGTIGAVQRLVHYTVLGAGLAVALQTLGVRLGTLFTAGAIVAVGLGFAMQNIAQNFVSGVILLLERSITPGDVLQIDGRVVTVREMGIRATIVRTFDNDELIVPNSEIVQSTVTNYTLGDSLYRIRCPVGVHYGSDIEQVFEVLSRVGEAFPHRHRDKPPVVLLRQFGNSSIDFELSVWIDDPWRMRPVASEVNRAIWHALKRAGIVIAYPQLDVHLDPPPPDAAPSEA